MILQKTKNTFKDKEGNVVEYNAFCVKGIISEIPFTITLKPYDESRLVKDVLTKNGNKADVQIKLVSHGDVTKDYVIVHIDELDSDIAFKCTESDKVLIKLYNKLSKK